MPIEETVGAMGGLVGRARCATSASRRRPRDNPPGRARVPDQRAPDRVLALDAGIREDELLPLCRELDIGFVAYSPLGRGFLTGRFRSLDDLPPDDYRRIPRFQGDNFQKNLDLVAHVEEIARRKKCTPSQLALAWVLAQGEDTVPIPGTKQHHPAEGECRFRPGALDTG